MNERVPLPWQKQENKPKVSKINAEGEKINFFFTDLVRYLLEIDEEAWTTVLSEFSESALEKAISVLTNEASKRKYSLRLIKNEILKKKMEELKLVIDLTTVGFLLEKFKNSLLAARTIKLNKNRVIKK